MNVGDRCELINDIVLAREERYRVVLPSGTPGTVMAEPAHREAAREAAAQRMDLAFLEAERAITRIEMLRKARAGAGAYKLAEEKLAEAEAVLNDCEAELAEFDRPLLRVRLDNGLCVLAESEVVRPLVSAALDPVTVPRQRGRLAEIMPADTA